MLVAFIAFMFDSIRVAVRSLVVLRDWFPALDFVGFALVVEGLREGWDLKRCCCSCCFASRCFSSRLRLVCTDTAAGKLYRDGANTSTQTHTHIYTKERERGRRRGRDRERERDSERREKETACPSQMEKGNATNPTLTHKQSTCIQLRSL